MEKEKHTTKWGGFSGPVTVAEIRKLLSMKKPVHMIGRRKSICVSEPSQSIYKEIPEIGMWKNIDLFNNSFELNTDSFVIDYENNTATGIKDSSSPNLSIDSVIVISDDENSYNNFDLNIENIKKDCTSLNSSDIDESYLLSSSAEMTSCSQNDELEINEDLCNSVTHNSTQEKVGLDDTLEYMEMLIKQMDYKGLSIDAGSSSSPSKSCSPPLTPETNEFKKPFSKIPIQHKKCELKKSNTSPLITKSKSAQFKDVVSPVALYIKNSPRVPLIKNVPLKPLLQKNVSPCQKLPNQIGNKENVLPPVIYMPPRQILQTTHSSVKVPSNIQVHLPQQAQIIKHTGRVAKKSESNIEEKLLGEDLSMFDFNNSNLSVRPEEISMHNCQDLFIL